jgi:hypothetical protein
MYHQINYFRVIFIIKFHFRDKNFHIPYNKHNLSKVQEFKFVIFYKINPNKA